MSLVSLPRRCSRRWAHSRGAALFRRASLSPRRVLCPHLRLLVAALWSAACPLRSAAWSCSAACASGLPLVLAMCCLCRKLTAPCAPAFGLRHFAARRLGDLAAAPRGRRFPQFRWWCAATGGGFAPASWACPFCPASSTWSWSKCPPWHRVRICRPAGY